jgi:hypothetical protein
MINIILWFIIFMIGLTLLFMALYFGIRMFNKGDENQERDDEDGTLY